MHGIDLKTQMDIVYHALNDKSKGIIDASCYGCDALNPGCPLTTHQPAKNQFVSYHETHT